MKFDFVYITWYNSIVSIFEGCIGIRPRRTTMILIPKHIENYMYQIEHFLVCSKSPKRDYFLDNLRYTIKSLKSFAGLSYISNDDLVEAFYLLVELVDFENELKEQVPSFKRSLHLSDVEAELTSVLNAYSYNMAYTDDVNAIINFIQKPIDDMYVSSCDYLHYKLIKSEEEWNNLSKEALIETDIFNILETANNNSKNHTSNY